MGSIDLGFHPVGDRAALAVCVGHSLYFFPLAVAANVDFRNSSPFLPNPTLRGVDCVMHRFAFVGQVVSGGGLLQLLDKVGSLETVVALAQFSIGFLGEPLFRLCR